MLFKRYLFSIQILKVNNQKENMLSFFCFFI